MHELRHLAAMLSGCLALARVFDLLLIGRVQMRQTIIWFLDGLAMGAANVIPGVSGGTVAVITGIFERLLNAIKAFDVAAARMALKGDWRGLASRLDLAFLLPLFVGVGVSILTLAKLFEHLLTEWPVPTFAFFFGLILVSVYYVGRQVSRWGGGCWLAGALGAAAAVGVALLPMAQSDSSMWYVFLCGAVAICSMILPGLSGSFVLLVMGNYLLIMAAIHTFDFSILIPFGAGCAIGLAAFARALSWVFKRWADLALSLMSGFIAGSLAIIWPWRIEKTELRALPGMQEVKEVVTGYEWSLPPVADQMTWIAIAAMIIGAATLVVTERAGERLSGGRS